MVPLILKIFLPLKPSLMKLISKGKLVVSLCKTYSKTMISFSFIYNKKNKNQTN